MPLLFLVLGVFGAIAGVLQAASLFLYGSVLCFALAYVSYVHGNIVSDLQSTLPVAPTRLLLVLGVLAILSGSILWSIHSREAIGSHFVRVVHPFSSQAIGLLLLGLIAIVIGLATRRSRVCQ